MSLLQVVYTFVFVFHNFSDIYCLVTPEILTAKKFLKIEKTKPIEIVTPVPQSDMVLKEETVPPKMFSLPSEMIYFPTEMSYFPTEMSHFPTEMTTFPTEVSTLPEKGNMTITKRIKNKIGHRVPKFLGRLAFLAGLGLAGFANAASSFNLDSRNPQSSITLNLPPAKLSPYFAAVFEPFSPLPQPYFFSNLFGFQSYNPQKLQTEANIPAEDNLHESHHQPVFTPTHETDHEVMNEEFHEEYVVENRKDDNHTMEGRIDNENVMEEMKVNPTTENILKENTSFNPEEEEPDENEKIEEIEESQESAEVNEDNLEPENLNFEFSPTIEQKPPRQNKPDIPFRPAKQSRPTTEKPSTKRPANKKPITKKPTVETTSVPLMPMNATSLNNSTQGNSTNSGNTTEPTIQNTTTSYPYFYGYYGGHSQNINDLYLTTSENPSRLGNYNAISPYYYSEDFLNNGIPIEPNSVDGFPHPNEVQASVIEGPTLIDDTNFFRGSQFLETASPPEFISSGFRPSIQY